MKQFTICTLIIVMLSGNTIPLFAYNDKAKKSVNKTWAKCLAEDSDGPLFAEAHIEVDIDYPDEGENWVEKAKHRLTALVRGGYGIKYEAYARVKGEAPNDDYEGEYDLYASVCFDDDSKNGTWDGKVDEKAKADDFVFLDEELTNWEALRANNELFIYAWGNVNGASPAKNWREWVKTESFSLSTTTLGTTWTLVNRHRPALSHNAFADVWNFSFSDVRVPPNEEAEKKWNCFQSGDTSCPECAGN